MGRFGQDVAANDLYSLPHHGWLLGKGFSIFCVVIACHSKKKRIHRTVHPEIAHRNIGVYNISGV